MRVTDLLTTTRSFRRRLDLSRPVHREEVQDCLDIAVCAPSGSNRQPWRFLVVQDPQRRRGIAQYYRKGFEQNMSGRTPRPDQLADLASARHLAEHLHEVPVLVLVCAMGRPPGTDERMLASFYGSVYPAVWNLQLALHARGLGSCLTTAHLAYEREVAGLLGLPFDQVTQVALLPVARLRPGRDTAPPRRPAAEVTMWDRWES
ncbi:nitroreductase family protein [Nocardia mexicana]|uniref:Nitroreductase n=1 Tax=Nocardia mexicana TaxID=279262 RepID=A0A370HD62_9NOCA|nr:nitroreductase family protein [Nocardia mexicana]RDI54345.1 nitroreductase [Nocardia mexicana]